MAFLPILSLETFCRLRNGENTELLAIPYVNLHKCTNETRYKIKGGKYDT